jgi:GNAT superfamily N-acetyltransferase
LAVEKPLLRPAAPGDELAVARVHVRSWQLGYRGLLPDAYLDGLKPEERAQRYTFGSADPGRPATLVALQQGTICGFATTAPARDADAQGQGELCALYVDPDCWGQGTGAILIAAARARLLAQGFRTAVLWVLDSNVRAYRFYSRDGWVADGSRRIETIWNVRVQELRYSRSLQERS